MSKMSQAEYDVKLAEERRRDDAITELAVKVAHDRRCIGTQFDVFVEAYSVCCLDRNADIKILLSLLKETISIIDSVPDYACGCIRNMMNESFYKKVMFECERISKLTGVR